jgi:hypothetical protein
MCITCTAARVVQSHVLCGNSADVTQPVLGGQRVSDQGDGRATPVSAYPIASCHGTVVVPQSNGPTSLSLMPDLRYCATMSG